MILSVLCSCSYDISSGWLNTLLLGFWDDRVNWNTGSVATSVSACPARISTNSSSKIGHDVNHNAIGIFRVAVIQIRQSLIVQWRHWDVLVNNVADRSNAKIMDGTGSVRQRAQILTQLRPTLWFQRREQHNRVGSFQPKGLLGSPSSSIAVVHGTRDAEPAYM